MGGVYRYVRLTAIKCFTSTFELDESATVCSTLNSYYTQHGLEPEWKKF